MRVIEQTSFGFDDLHRARAEAQIGVDSESGLVHFHPMKGLLHFLLEIAQECSLSLQSCGFPYPSPQMPEAM
ncbi:MAG: hypothetical protein ACKO1K_02265 [Burkholderiales bacterium]